MAVSVITILAVALITSQNKTNQVSKKTETISCIQAISNSVTYTSEITPYEKNELIFQDTKVEEKVVNTPENYVAESPKISNTVKVIYTDLTEIQNLTEQRTELINPSEKVMLEKLTELMFSFLL